MITRSRALLIGVIALLAGGALTGLGFAIGSSSSSKDSAGATLKRVVVARATPDDAAFDKWLKVFCPPGYTVIGGGGNIPHANDTPGVAMYWSAPFAQNAWQAAAQDTGRRSRRWTMRVVAVCVKPVTEGKAAGASLTPEVYQP